MVNRKNPRTWFYLFHQQSVEHRARRIVVALVFCSPLPFFADAVKQMSESLKKQFEFRNYKATLSFLIKPLESEIDNLHFSAFAGIVNQADFEL